MYKNRPLEYVQHDEERREKLRSMFGFKTKQAKERKAMRDIEVKKVLEGRALEKGERTHVLHPQEVHGPSCSDAEDAGTGRDGFMPPTPLRARRSQGPAGIRMDRFYADLASSPLPLATKVILRSERENQKASAAPVKLRRQQEQHEQPTNSVAGRPTTPMPGNMSNSSSDYYDYCYYYLQQPRRENTAAWLFDGASSSRGGIEAVDETSEEKKRFRNEFEGCDEVARLREFYSTPVKKGRDVVATTTTPYDCLAMPERSNHNHEEVVDASPLTISSSSSSSSSSGFANESYSSPHKLPLNADDYYDYFYDYYDHVDRQADVAQHHPNLLLYDPADVPGEDETGERGMSGDASTENATYSPSEEEEHSKSRRLNSPTRSASCWDAPEAVPAGCYTVPEQRVAYQQLMDRSAASLTGRGSGDSEPAPSHSPFDELAADVDRLLLWVKAREQLQQQPIYLSEASPNSVEGRLEYQDVPGLFPDNTDQQISPSESFQVGYPVADSICPSTVTGVYCDHVNTLLAPASSAVVERGSLESRTATLPQGTSPNLQRQSCPKERSPVYSSSEEDSSVSQSHSGCTSSQESSSISSSSSSPGSSSIEDSPVQEQQLSEAPADDVTSNSNTDMLVVPSNDTLVDEERSGDCPSEGQLAEGHAEGCIAGHVETQVELQLEPHAGEKKKAKRKRVREGVEASADKRHRTEKAEQGGKDRQAAFEKLVKDLRLIREVCAREDAALATFEELKVDKKELLEKVRAKRRKLKMGISQ